MIGTIIGLATSAAGSIWGAVSSARKSREAQAVLDRQHTANQDWYNREYNTDYTQRADVQRILTKQRDLLSEAYKRARATNVVAGGSDNSLAMLQNSANQSLADTISSVASSGQTYKDNINSQRLAESNQYAQGVANVLNGQAQQDAQAAGQVTKAGAGMMSADNKSWKDEQENWGWLFKRKGGVSEA